MRSLPVVEDLDVFEGLAACAVAVLEGAVPHELFLEGREEALGHGVVPAVALAAHARAHLVAPESASEGVAGVLRAAVAVEDQAWLGASETDRGVQRVTHERRGHALGEAPAHDFARV